MRNGPAADVLTLNEAAAYLRLAEPDVLRLIQEQGLPARQVGAEWRFLKTAIQQWLSTATPTLETRKEAQLALAGKHKDDPDVMRFCEEAYQQRGRRLPEDD
jgi:excisionase family DNA binding protein